MFKMFFINKSGTKNSCKKNSEKCFLASTKILQQVYGPIGVIDIFIRNSNPNSTLTEKVVKELI